MQDRILAKHVNTKGTQSTKCPSMRYSVGQMCCFVLFFQGINDMKMLKKQRGVIITD